MDDIRDERRKHYGKWINDFMALSHFKDIDFIWYQIADLFTHK